MSVTFAQLAAATLVPLACWRVSTTMSIIDDVFELELLNLNAWGGHFTVGLAMDVHPGRLTSAIDMLRPYAFPVLLLSVLGLMVLSIGVCTLLARALQRVLVGCEVDGAGGNQLSEVTSSVARTQQLLSERQMELAALHSKSQHLEDEIRRAALTVDRLQRQLRTTEALRVHCSASTVVACSTAHTGASTIASSSATATSPSSSDTHATHHEPETPPSAASGAHRASDEDARYGALAVLNAARRSGDSAHQSEAFGSASPPKREADSALLEEWDLSSPALDRFARLLGLSCPSSRANTASQQWVGGDEYDRSA
jgi:hypothetical protein